MDDDPEDWLLMVVVCVLAGVFTFALGRVIGQFLH